MSEEAAQQEEPSIEEILGSIRRIISDDDEPAEEVAAQEDTEEVQSEEIPEETPSEPVSQEAEVENNEDDVLELTQMIEDDGNVIDKEEEPEQELEPVEDVKIDMLDDEPKPDLDPVVEDLPPVAKDEPLVSEGAADVTAAVMAKLARSAAVTRRPEGIAIEDIVRELVKPMLRQWLDDNLPDIVEQMVERELERIARRAKD